MSGLERLGFPSAEHASPLPVEDRPYAMAVCALPGIGPVRSRRLRDRTGSFRAAWDLGPRGWLRLGIPGLRAGHGHELESAWRSVIPGLLVERLHDLGIQAAFEGDPQYPPGLREISVPPLVVYIRGEIRAEDRPAVALVGTRRMSAYGQWMGLRLASGLAREGVSVVSGLARGIDSAAHRGALEAGGRTLAVLPGGLDVVYPPEHTGLAAEIAARGGLISEHPPGTPVLPGSFPARNRLIAGICAATVVIEAGVRSGALITAGFALEQGREVLAVPGRVGALGSCGVHALLKDGAGLVESAGDILAALPARQARATGPDRTGRGSSGGAKAPGRDAETDPLRLDRRLLELLQRGPLAEREIIELLGAAADEVRARLVMLEMEDRVQRLPGAVYTTRGADRR